MYFLVPLCFQSTTFPTFFGDRPFIFTPVIYFQIDSGLKYFNLNKLTVKGIFAEKDYQYRKMRITNEFFGINLPRKSQITKNDLVLAKKHS